MALVEDLLELPAEAWRLFTITKLDQAVAVLSGSRQIRPQQERRHCHEPA